MWNTDRTQYIAGLRQLADLLENNDDLPVPTHGEIEWLIFEGSGTHLPASERLAEQKATAATIVRRLGGAKKDEDPSWLFSFKRTLGGENGLGLQVTVNREAVCERVVTGTREVVKTVPDPSVDVPLVEVTETVEDVQWECSPLLAEAAEAAS